MPMPTPSPETAPVGISPELSDRPRRRTFTAKDKLRILAEVDAAAQTGGIGAILRREGIYSSLLSDWRRQRDAGSYDALSPAKRGPKVAPVNPMAADLTLARAENARLQERLDRAEIIITCWDPGFQPGDARTARAKHLGTDPVTKRLIIDRSGDGREKTGVAVIGTLSRLGDVMVRRYLEDLGVSLTGEAFLFRTRTNQPYRDTVLSHDFQAIRAIADPNDKRQLRDMRRSGTTEAFRGGADPKL